MSQSVLGASDLRRTLGRIAHEILEANQGSKDLVVVGVLRKGWPVAKRLAFLMTQVEGVPISCGKIDVRPYRDDNQIVDSDDSELPFGVTDKIVILVDEVVYTGRTIRAALDGLMRAGRPKKVELAVLIDRGHRELPIQPDYCGKKITTEHDDHIVVKLMEEDGEDAVLLLPAAEKSTEPL